MSNNEPKRGTLAFKKRFVDNVEVVSKNECWVLDESGNRRYRVCGAIRKDGKRCLSPPGAGTSHVGVGRCLQHDLHKEGKGNWLEMTADLAKETKLGKMLKNSQDFEVRINDLTQEISFQQGLILWYVDYVMNRDEVPNFTKEDIRFLKELNIDMIRSKESAARIKGSTKLDLLTVRQFVDQIFSFLVTELSMISIKKEVMVGLMKRMMEQVFAPMTATGLIQKEMTPLAQIPEKYQNMSIVNKEHDDGK